MYSIFAQISVGLAAGVFIKWITPSKSPGSFIVNAGIGLIGSLVGALAGRALFGTDSGLAGWVISFLGALLTLSFYRVLTGPRAAY